MHENYMELALSLAKKGEGFTNPNPLVGAVIVKDDNIIGEGYHEVYGSHHAEINAFLHATEDVKGATMYVTLEPCSHFGNTPPCAYEIVKKGIKQVIIAMTDPNPQVSGKGIQILKEHGIEVITGILEKESRKMNEIFIKYITTGYPFCIMKTAMTLDGKIAAFTGDSKWITNEKSREYVHKLRHRVASVMVGIGTIEQDDPFLTTRLPERNGKDAIRIIVDSKARISLNANVLNLDSTARTIIATTELASMEKRKLLEEKGAEIIITPLEHDKVNLPYLMKALGERKIDSVLLEGGSELNYSAMEATIVDKVISFIAPKIIGGREAKTPMGGEGLTRMKDAIHLSDMEVQRFGEDVMLEAYVDKKVCRRNGGISCLPV